MNPKLKKHFGSKPIVWVAAWGISKLRKRGGKFAGSICGEALYYDEWHDNVMSEKTAKKLEELGVNLIVLPFSVGGSAEAEKEERDNFQSMTEFLHKHKIVSLPYIQYQNILQETFEFPHTEWAKRLDGSETQYCYWRKTVCQSSREFIDYFKGLISDAIKRGGDGIWIDNNYLKPCKCNLCKANFISYLKENRKDLLDELPIESFDRIAMPPSVNNAFDPIVQALMDFNCKRNIVIHEELKSHLENLSPFALFGSNPALYRGTSHFANGVDFKRIVELNDLMYLENKFFPEQSKDGQTVGNYHGFISCDAVGSKAIPGAWKREDFDSTGKIETTGLPETKEEVEKVIYESAAFGGAPGMLWCVRSMPRHLCKNENDLLKMYMEYPPVYEAMKTSLDFIKELPVFGDSENIANVAVLHHRESIKLDFDASWASLHSMEELLLQNAIPFNVLFSEDLEKAEKYDLLILPDASVIKDSEVQILEDYTKKGGRILATGTAGLYNERMRPRKDFALKNLLSASSFSKDKGIIFNEHGKGKTAYVPSKGLTDIALKKMMSNNPAMRYPEWTEKKAETIDAINSLLSDKRQIKINSQEPLGTSLRKTEDGRTALQILSYGKESANKSIKAQISQNLSRAETARWLIPGAKEEKINAKKNENYLEFELRNFKSYGVLVLDD